MNFRRETMPIYEYSCKECRNRFELLVGVNEVPVCPRCGGLDLEKELSVFAVGGASQPRCPGRSESCTACCAEPGTGGCPLSGPG